jgi:hypothetical protein
LGSLPVSDDIFDDGIPFGGLGAPLTGEKDLMTGHYLVLFTLPAMTMMTYRRRKQRCSGHDHK